MSSHPDNCPCVNCNPTPCTDCGMASPGGTHLNSSGVCSHRKACEGRQLIGIGFPVEAAAAHAQGLDREAGGVSSQLDDVLLDQANALAVDEWPYPDEDPPDPL